MKDNSVCVVHNITLLNTYYMFTDLKLRNYNFYFYYIRDYKNEIYKWKSKNTLS